MTLDDFLSYAINKTFCFPEGKYCGECLSLIKQRIKLVEGFDPPASGVNAAYGYWTNFPSPLPQYFKKTQTPKRGDIVVWGTGVGEYGHIAIFLEKSGSGFYSLDQNWNGKHAHKQYHNFSNILGYLTPKGVNMEIQEVIKVQGDSKKYAFGEYSGADTAKEIPYSTVKPSLLWEALKKSREAQKTIIEKNTKEIVELKKAHEDELSEKMKILIAKEAEITELKKKLNLCETGTTEGTIEKAIRVIVEFIKKIIKE